MAYDEVASSLAERDALDQGRTHSPLAVADDAVVLDTSDRDVDAIVDDVVGLLHR
jgi:cytidylate kinase